MERHLQVFQNHFSLRDDKCVNCCELIWAFYNYQLQSIDGKSPNNASLPKYKSMLIEWIPYALLSLIVPFRHSKWITCISLTGCILLSYSPYFQHLVYHQNLHVLMGNVIQEMSRLDVEFKNHLQFIQNGVFKDDKCGIILMRCIESLLTLYTSCIHRHHAVEYKWTRRDNLKTMHQDLIEARTLFIMLILQESNKTKITESFNQILHETRHIHALMMLDWKKEMDSISFSLSNLNKNARKPFVKPSAFKWSALDELNSLVNETQVKLYHLNNDFKQESAGLEILDERAQALLNQFKEKSNYIAQGATSFRVKDISEDEMDVSTNDQVIHHMDESSSLHVEEEYFEADSIPIARKSNRKQSVKSQKTSITFVEFQRGIMNELKSVIGERNKD